MKNLNFRNWRPKQLKEALLPLSVINWISGLNVVEIPVGHPRPMLSLIFLIILVILYYYVPVTYGIFACDSKSMQNAGQILFDIMWFYNEIIGWVSIIVNWYYRNVGRLCIQRIELIDFSLACFGIANNHGEIFVRLVLTLTVTFFGILFLVASDIFWHLREYDLKQSICCAYSSELPIILQVIIELSFATMVTIIGYSFRNINTLLEKSSNQNLLLEKAYLSRKQLKVRTLVLPSEFNFNTSEKSRNLIQLIKHQHLELSKVAWEVEKVYGLQITMSMVSNITLVIGNAYYIYDTIFQSNLEKDNNEKVVFIVNGISWCILYLVRVWYVNGTCANVTIEAHKAEELIFSVKRAKHDAELRKEIEQFSLQLAQRPLFFSMYGLTSLDYSFVASFLGTVVTYLIIVIQIEPKSKANVTDTITEIYTTLTTPMS